MSKLLVRNIITSAFSKEQANNLYQAIKQNLYDSIDEPLVVDFSGITRFTTLFFNFSLGQLLYDMGEKKYNDTFIIEGLSELGQNAYSHSYENIAHNNSNGNSTVEEEIKRILFESMEDDI